MSFDKTIDQLIQNHKVVITCGTGGVGKTTTSSALALRAAQLGKRAVVVTLDPAKRLKTSLGVESIGDEPLDLTEELKKRNSTLSPGGKFYAIVPDTRRTLEQMIHDVSSKPETAQKILSNPIFKILSNEYSGANEYMSLQKLIMIQRDPRFDFVVLDTPPSRNTLAFLYAPELVMRFFNEKMIRMLLPANRILAAGIRKTLSVLEHLSGSGFLSHFFELGQGVVEIQERFVSQLAAVTQFLHSSEVGFVVVGGPSVDLLPDIEHLIDTIQQKKFQFAGSILNRSQGHLKPSIEDWQTAKNAVDKEGLERGLRILEASARREKRVRERLRLKGSFLAVVPELARDVHSLEDLLHVASLLSRPISPASND